MEAYPRIAFFPDTYGEIDGVANTSRQFEAFAKKRCAEEASKKESRPLGAFAVEAHGCAAVFDTSKLSALVKFPEVKVRAAVAGGRLLITLGDPAKRPPGAAQGGDAVDGEPAKLALGDAETLLFFTHNLGIGPEVRDLFAAIPRSVFHFDLSSTQLREQRGSP